MSAEICNVLGPESPHRTTVTRSAYRKLISWGMPSDRIDHLQSLISQFEYARIPDRLRLLTRQIAYFDPATDTISIPHFHDNSGHLTGQCGPLARQLLTCLLTADYLPFLNQHPPHHPNCLQACLVSGQSATHFTHQPASHAWVALKRQRDVFNRDLIYIDPSFQSISTAQESGYQPQLIVIDPCHFTVPTTAKFGIGKLTYENNPNSIRSLEAKVVIGITDNRDYAVCLTFGRHEGSPRIHPVIAAIDYTGRRGYHLFPPPQEGFPIIIPFNFPQPLPPTTRDNLLAILAGAQKFRLSAYPMPEIHQLFQTVQFDPAPGSLVQLLKSQLKRYVPRI